MKKMILAVIAIVAVATSASADLTLGNAVYSSSGNYLDVMVKYQNNTGRNLSYIEIKCTAFVNDMPIGQAMINKLGAPAGYSEWMKGSIRINNQNVDEYSCQVTEER